MFLKPTSGLHDRDGRMALSVAMADGTMMRSLIGVLVQSVWISRGEEDLSPYWEAVMGKDMAACSCFEVLNR